MMKLLHQKIFRILFIIFLSLSPQLWGQVQMTTTGSYNQNFDGLNTSTVWTNDSTIPNWYASRPSMIQNIGQGNAGSMYNFGNSTDRALGSICSGGTGLGTIAYGVLLRNTSGATITNITVSYTMEQWRNGGADSDAQPLAFLFRKSTSKIDETNITNNTNWTNVTDLTLYSVINNTTPNPSTGALNGNLPANRNTATNVSLPGLSLANGEYIMLKWYDINDPGNDHGLSVDDLTINWTVPVANSAPIITVSSPQTFTYGTAGSYTFTVAGSPAPTTAQIDAFETGQAILPTGITLDASTKKINVASTVPAGTYNLTISASNSSGTDTEDLEIVVNKANQTIVLNDITKAFGDPDFTLSTAGSAAGTTVTYTSGTPAVASITGNTVSIVGVGSSIITASNSGNANYNAASTTGTLTVTKANQAITFSNIAKTYGDADFTLTATGGTSGEAISYVSANNNIATISGSTVTITGTGTVNITASQAGNANYNAAANVTRTLTVTPKTITVTGAATLDKTYDGNTTATLSPSAAITSSDIVGSDVVALNTYTASFNTAAVGTAKPVTAIYTLTGAQAARYTLTQPTGLTAAITAKELTISGIQINNKPEDGNTTAAITGTAALDGIISPDVVALNGSGASASFADAAIGTNKPVTVSGYVLSGANAANYTLQQPQGLTASITDITLQDQTITFSPLANVTYGDADFALTATASSNLTVTYTSSDTSVANVNGSMITVVGVGTTTITAQQGGDSTHNPAPAITQNLTVAPKALTVINTAVTAKTYDKTTTAQVSGTLSGVIGSEDVSLVSGTATFATDDAGTGINITTQFSITGTDSGNYTITQPVTTGTITPAALTLTNPAANNKAYNGTTAAIVTGTLSGILSGDTVTLSGSGTFASSAVGTGIVVTSTSTLTGTDSSNYTLTQPTGLTANITGLFITVTATAVNKVYDRTTDAAITVTQTNGVVTGDDVTVTGGGTFNTATTGTNKTVTANLTLSGTAAGNYTFTQPTGLTAAITTKDVTIDTSNTTVTTKAYNGSTAAQLNNTTITGLVAGDETNVSASTGTFAQATPGTGIVVNNISLTGTAATNYSLTQPSNLTGNITPAVITFSGVAAIGKVYDGTDAASIAGNLAGKVGSDVVSYIGTGTFASKNIGTAIPVTANVTLTGANASYYTIIQPTGLSATITRKNITVTGTPENKVYNRTTAATITNGTITAGSIITGDDVSLVSTTATGTFANYNAGTAINVTALFALQGADAANYNVASQVVGTADITPLTITADITNAVVTKQYSNTNTAVTTGVTLVGYIPADVPGLQAVQGTYASVLPGVNIPITIVLSGSNAANYILTQPGLTGTITKRMLTVTAANKTKLQGAANPALTFTVSNFASGESAANAAGYIAPTISTTAQVSSPVGTYPIAVAGGSADNYEFTLVNGWLEVTTATVFNNGSLWSNPITGTDTYLSNPYTTGQLVPAASYISVSGIGRAPSLNGSAASNRYSASGWDTTSLNTNRYFTFTITPSNGYAVKFASFAYTAEKSGSGAPNIAVRSSLDNYTSDINTAVITGSTTSQTVSLADNAYQNVSTPITFRIYAWGASASTGTFSINDFAFNGSVKIASITTTPAITSLLTDNSVIGTTDTYQITATGTPALALSAENLPAGAAVNASGLISFDGTTPAGQYTIALMAESYYGTDSKNLVYTVSKKDQTVTFNPDPIPTKFLNEAPFVITATNNVPLAVTYSSADTAVATVAQDGTITITGVGTTIITASNTGDTIYNEVSISRNFTVVPTPVITAAPASIAFSAIQGQGPSAATQLTSISWTDLSPATGNLTLTASSGFEVATGIGTYSSTATSPYVAGTVNQANPPIYVRLAAGHAAGTYNGTLTITGGNTAFTVTITGSVELAPAVITTATAFGPYCFGTQNTISVPYTTQGTFASGSYYVQLSDNTGVFPTNFDPISAPATSSPITAVLPATLTAGNYRVRVIHLSTALTLTSSINDNGSNVVINLTPAPTAAPLIFCASDSPTVTDLTATGNELKWYADANSTTSLALTDVVTTGSYYVSQTLNQCESAKTVVAVTVNVTPVPVPVTTPLTFCTPTSVSNLTATGNNLIWYADATSTTPLNLTDVVTTGNYYVSQTLNQCESAKTAVAVTVNVTPVPVTTPLTLCPSAIVANLTATGTELKWYADANSTTPLNLTDVVIAGNYYVSQTLNQCESAKTVVAVTISVTPAPIATPLSFCTATTVTNLTATGSELKWYADANSSTPLNSTDIVTTGNYYVSQTLNQCESAKTAVAVTINVTPAPIATPLSFCTPTTVTNLTATGSELKWYADANSSTPLNSTDIVTTGNYYVSQTLNQCESDKTAVTVTINVTPTPVTTSLILCPLATVADLTATGSELKWYDDANSTTPLNSTDVVIAGNYYVSQTLNQCESAKTEVVVTVNVTPTPVTTPLTLCPLATVADLTATGIELKWYADANSTTPLNLTDVVIAGNYYVSQTLNQCESAKTEVVVTVNVTPAPIATPLSFCTPTTVTNLTATGSELKWYADANNATPLNSTNVVTTGNYYVSQTVNGCESERTEVTVTINNTPAPIAAPLTFNEGATVANLTATGTNLKWYDAATGGNLLSDSELLTSGNYFVSQTVNGCESTRTEVTVTITTISTPDAPTASAQTFCNAATAEDLAAQGEDLKWYDTADSTTALAPGDVLVTGNYYVSQTINNVESSRTEVQVTITITASPEGETTQLFSEDGKTISDLEADGQNIKWYATEADALAQVNELADDTLLVSETTYYATQTINGCESKEVLAVTVSITLGMDDVTKFSYKYYPNPVVDKLYIESAETVTNVTVYTLTGQEVIHQKWNTQGGMLDVSSLQSAVYIVKIKFGTIEKTIKMVKDKK